MSRQIVLVTTLLGVLLLLATVSCLVVPQVLWPIPAPTPTPKVRDFALRELFIHLSDLSSDCRFEHPPTELAYEDNVGAEEAFSTRFICDSRSAIGGYAIYRFRNSQAAVSGYRHIQREWFYNAFRITPYMTPDWIGYQNLVADQIRFACADFQDYTELRYRRCVAVSQYEEYVSAFSFGISPPERMADYTGFLEQMLRAIDEWMADYLGKEAE